MTLNADTLADELRRATVAYAVGNPVMTDAAFDAKEDQLRRMNPTHPYFSEVGSPSGDGWAKVTHPIPMGSLDKAQTEEEFLAWAAKVGCLSSDRAIFVTQKMDGISLLLVYEKGELVRAETRGDGLTGQDITRNARIMKGVSSHVLYDGTLYIRGEIVCRKSDHAEHFPDESNPRNTAAGKSVAQSDWRRAQHLTFYAYNLTSETHKAASRSAEFEVLKGWGFNVPGHLLVQNPKSVIELRQDYIDRIRDTIDYDIDGLVVEIDDTEVREAFGHHNHRPKGAIAFKFPHDAKTTTLRDIVWQVGPSGRVTPVAQFDAVGLAGASVKQASLHNVGNIARLVADSGQQYAFEGDHILVSRRNDVIPFVEEFLGTNETEEGAIPLHVPGSCPVCGSDLSMSGEYLICPNEEGCPAQTLGSLKRWISKLGVLHLGEAILTAVVEAGMVKSIGDLYRLEEGKVAALSVDGRRIGGSASRGLKNLHEKKELPLDLFIGSLGIPLVGRKMTKLLVDAGFDDLSKMGNATETEMAAVEGFGPVRAAAFRKGFDDRRALILDILAAGVTLAAPIEVLQTGTAMVGQAVCFTGVRDKAAEEEIVAQGGSIASGVSKNTTLLVVKDVTSSSSKMQKALSLGIEIIDLPELWKRLKGSR